ncbi:hypothetical protein CBG50_08895 [Fusobacterium polymorphum]|jgi:trypsin|uniref:Peptidase S1 domain-containing protein n=1 Tax=Fusobacterium nucleatum subsp. polymorphum TaxID=76857 RepID=A0A1Z3CKD3_FUSNP|nr:trypsin-like serine protease [Fusobacterium polymorphum]ASC03393.1 hypothetical protein CBG50_08895 [Fusobacterium polymorphum]DAX72244.1 MAG TPA: Serine protease [Caudoviricetes sp.]
MNEWFKLVTKIELLNSKGEVVSYGSGFFYAVGIDGSEAHLPCIVTAKHLLDNPDYSSYRFLIQSTNDFTNEVSQIEVIFAEKEIDVVENEFKDLALIYLKNVALKKSKNFLRPTFLKYENTSSPWIMHNFLSTENNAYGLDIYGNRKMINIQNDNVSIIGYHYGDDIYNLNSPIGLHGLLTMDASKSTFIVQAPANKGSSGSPIFAEINGATQLIGIVSEQCRIGEKPIEGLFYAVSSQGISLLEQIIIEKLGSSTIEKIKDQVSKPFFLPRKR